MNGSGEPCRAIAIVYFVVTVVKVVFSVVDDEACGVSEETGRTKVTCENLEFNAS